MSETPHPYRVFVEQEVQALGASIVDMLDLGFEVPFDGDVVRIAHERMYITGVIELARRDRRWVQVWLLRRHLNAIVQGGLSRRS